METYKEYHVCCPSCRMVIAANADEYEALLQDGLSIEEALNSLGYDDECCRHYLMNPGFVPFDMEDREAIEGYKTVEAVKTPGWAPRRTQPEFKTCLRPGAAIPMTGAQYLTTAPLPQYSPTTLQTQLPPLPGIGVQLPPISGLGGLPAGGIGGLPPIGGLPGGGLPGGRLPPIGGLPATGLGTLPVPGTPVGVLPGLPAGGLKVPILNPEVSPEGVPVVVPTAVAEFKEPTRVGFPTINHDPRYGERKVYVGADKHCLILNNRAYLAR